ncbi:MAG TPA: lipid A biosynthesis acyltransferase [Rhodocyclaceae bacterium]|nr:lipid A biosynthesis acyltransferase [Rhodocyclaceae bacterium]
MTRFALFIMWLLHWLPLSLLAPLGRILGLALYWLIPKRRHIVRTNLRLCFPELSEAEREKLAREHLALLGRSLLERSLSWWASEARLKRLIKQEGLEHLVQDGKRATDAPVILLVPHFLGLDISGTRISMDIDVVSIYSKQKNEAIDRLLLHGRTRFGNQQLLSRQDGIRATVKALREGRPLYYLPDMDYGPRDAVFVPFFGVPAATITGLSRMAKLTGAKVHSCIAEILPGGQGYISRISPAWENFPTDDVEADTRRMNAFIEAEAKRIPAQYYWVHKRFKTRPEGESGFY